MPLEDAAPDRAQTVWRVEMLGRLRAVPLEIADGVTRRSEPVEQFRTHKAALLLARLALFPDRAQGREELADALWPDALADRGRANLTQTLVYLRQALRESRTDGLFLSNHKTVRVAAARLRTDVAEWEVAARHALASGIDEPTDLLRSALDAYGGPLLPGFYDDWICDERSRLEALHQALTDRLRSLPSLPARPQTPVLRNAPLFLTRFIGRESERTRVEQVLAEDPPVRLLTLIGMGGIGKTRFSLEVVPSVLKGNVFGWATFVPLAEAQTAHHMESILREVLVLQKGGLEGIAASIHHLNGCAARNTGRLLLVLDNLEQMKEAAAPVVSLLLAGVPTLTILATSRQPVGIAGEQEMRIGSLRGDVDGTDEIPPDDVRLFVDRARLICPQFTLTPENRTAVSRLCTLLEGVPLALELAAAWARVLTPEQIASRLRNRFDLLALRGASRAGDGLIHKRHQSLQATIAWSYDLLSPSLQTFWAQLSVFRGGWTAEAAQAVTGINDIGEPLLLLAERSLVLAEADETTGEMRYRMLESLREFAQEQLKAMEPGRYSTLCLRHALYFAQLAREANAAVETGHGMRPALILLEPERENLRVVYARLQEQTAERAPIRDGDPVFVSGAQAAIHCLLESRWLWSMNERRQYLRLAAEAAAELPAEIRVPLRAAVLSQQGVHSLHAGDHETAVRYLRESLSLWKSIGNREQSFAVRKQLASVASASGDQSGAVDLLLRCLEFARETGNPYLEADVLNNLANDGPNLEQRRAWIEQAVRLDRRNATGSYLLACSLNSMGGIAFEQKDWKTARACLEEAHGIAVGDGAPGMIGVTKMSLAELLSEMGESPERPRELLRDAQRIFEEKEEPLRVAQVHLLLFQVALRNVLTNQAIEDARAYLRVNHDAGLMDSKALASAREDLENQLRTAGYKEDPHLLHGVPGIHADARRRP